MMGAGGTKTGDPRLFAVFFVQGEVRMRPMAKETGDRSPKLSTEQSLRSRRRRGVTNTHGHFVRAFADALRDILREERRRAA